MLKHFTRGGQTTMHAIQMFGQVSKRLILLSFLLYTIVGGFYIQQKTTKYQWYLLGNYVEALLEIAIYGNKAVHSVKESTGATITMAADQFIRHQFLVQQLNNFSTVIHYVLLTSLKGSIIFLMGVIMFLGYRGKLQTINQDIRGALFLDSNHLKKFLKKHKKCSDLNIAGVPLVKDSETKHILITGTTGSGKSICMMELMDHIRRRKQRAIVYDDSGTFIKHYYRHDHDIILNPLDERSPGWNIWQESEDLADFEAIASSLMPLHLSGSDPFWIHSARTIFATLAEKLRGHDLHLMSKAPTKELLQSCLTPSIVYDANNNISQLIIKTCDQVKAFTLTELKEMPDFSEKEKLFNSFIKSNSSKGRVLLRLTDPIMDWITSKAKHAINTRNTKTKSLLCPMFSSDLGSLSSLLHGTVAEPLVAGSVEKMALSIKSTLATYCKSFLYLKDEGVEPLFSIKRWIQNEVNDSWIFIATNADKLEALKPLISVWLDVAARSMLSLTPSFDRRIWLLIDELASLHRLSSLSLLLSQGRKYGVCGVTAFQDIHQLRSIYGRDEAEALLSMYNTNLCYRTKCPDTAVWMSRLTGQREVIEKREGFSYGANDIRDGVSVQQERRKEPLILDTEFLKLNDCEAYMLLPENTPVTKIKLTAKSRPILSEALHPRKSLDLSLTTDLTLDAAPLKSTNNEDSIIKEPVPSKSIKAKKIVSEIMEVEF